MTKILIIFVSILLAYVCYQLIYEFVKNNFKQTLYALAGALLLISLVLLVIYLI